MIAGDDNEGGEAISPVAMFRTLAIESRQRQDFLESVFPGDAGAQARDFVETQVLERAFRDLMETPSRLDNENIDDIINDMRRIGLPDHQLDSLRTEADRRRSGTVEMIMDDPLSGSNVSRFDVAGDSDDGSSEDELGGILPINERVNAAPSGDRADAPNPSLGVLSRQLVSAAGDPNAFPVIGDRVQQLMGSRRRPIDLSDPPPPDGRRYIDLSRS